MDFSPRSAQVSPFVASAAALALAATAAACGVSVAASAGAGEDASPDAKMNPHGDAGRDSSAHRGDSGGGDAASEASRVIADSGHDGGVVGPDGPGDSPVTSGDTGAQVDGGGDAGAVDACTGTCVLAVGQDRPTGIAVDDHDVYWLNAGPTGTVVKVAASGGTPVTLTAGQYNSVGIAVDPTSVYFTTSNTVQKMPLGGAADGGVALASGSDVNAPACLAVDSKYVYWANNGGLNSGAVGSIVEVPLAGGAPVTLAQHLLNPYGIAVDSQNVYWTTGDAVMKLALTPPPDGGVNLPSNIAVNQSSPWTIAVDAHDVYWATTTGGTVVKAPVAGGTPTTLVTGQPTPWGVASDGSNVFWTTDVIHTGTVVELGLDGGTAITLSSTENQPQFIAVRAGRVHWTDDTGDVVTWTPSQ